MQYIVSATDFNEPGAIERRIAAREAHLSGISDMKPKGQVLFAAAKTDDTGRMVGSLLVVQFADRSELDQWLATEPYVRERVWDRIEITPCKVPPLFLAP